MNGFKRAVFLILSGATLAAGVLLWTAPRTAESGPLSPSLPAATSRANWVA